MVSNTNGNDGYRLTLSALTRRRRQRSGGLLFVTLLALLGCSSSKAGNSADVTGGSGVGGAPVQLPTSTAGAGGSAAPSGSSAGASGIAGTNPPTTAGSAIDAGSGAGGQAGSAGAGGIGATAGASGPATGGHGASDAGASGSGAAGSSSSSFNPCPTTGAACKVLPFGDSITYGVGSEASGGGGYRVDLFSRAVMAAKKLTFVGTQMNGPMTVAGMPFPQHHAGYSGYTVAQITAASLFNAEVATAPHIVLLHIGTNDMLRSDGPTAPQRLATLVDDLVTALPNALIVVAKIIPLKSGMTQVNTYNTAIEPLIEQRVQAGKHVVLVDQNTAFPAGGLGSDGVHPNAMGYQYMGGVWYAAIGSSLP